MSKTKPETTAETTSTAAETAVTPAVSEQQPMPVPKGGWPLDEYSGKAGHYVRDPFTGVRRRVADANGKPAAPNEGASPDPV